MLAMATYGWPVSAAPVWWIAKQVRVWDRTVQRHMRYLACRGCEDVKCPHRGLIEPVEGAWHHDATSYRFTLPD